MKGFIKRQLISLSLPELIRIYHWLGRWIAHVQITSGTPKLDKDEDEPYIRD